MYAGEKQEGRQRVLTERVTWIVILVLVATLPAKGAAMKPLGASGVAREAFERKHC